MWYHNFMKQAQEILCGVCIFKEGKLYVSYSPQLDLASCGKTVSEAKKNFAEAFSGFVQTANEQGTLEQILEEAGYQKKGASWVAPKLLNIETLSLSLSH